MMQEDINPKRTAKHQRTSSGEKKLNVNVLYRVNHRILHQNKMSSISPPEEENEKGLK